MTLRLVLAALLLAALLPAGLGQHDCAAGLALPQDACRAYFERPVLPVFIRLHKVSSTTVAVFLECARVQAPALVADRLWPWLNESCADQPTPHAQAFAPWAKEPGARRRCCLHTQKFDKFTGPWTHRVTNLYATQQLHTVVDTCVQPGTAYDQHQHVAPPSSWPPHLHRPGRYRFITILRHPKESFWSIVNFFGPGKLHGPTERVRIRVAQEPETATADDVGRLARDIDAVMSPLNGIRQYSTVLGGAALRSDKAWAPSGRVGTLASTEGEHPPDAEHLIDRAHQRLLADFVVGLSHDLMGFLVLLALELGWPLQVLCLPFAHTRRKDEKRAEVGRLWAGRLIDWNVVW